MLLASIPYHLLGKPWELSCRSSCTSAASSTCSLSTPYLLARKPCTRFAPLRITLINVSCCNTRPMLMLSSRSHFPPGAYTCSASSKIQTEFIIVLALAHRLLIEIFELFSTPPPKRPPIPLEIWGC